MGRICSVSRDLRMIEMRIAQRELATERNMPEDSISQKMAGIHRAKHKQRIEQLAGEIYRELDREQRMKENEEFLARAQAQREAQRQRNAVVASGDADVTKRDKN